MTVVAICRDDVELVFAPEAACESALVREIEESTTTHEGQQHRVRLQTIDSDVLRLVVDWSIDPERCLLSGLSREALFRLLEASNFLQMPRLICACSTEAAARMEGMSVERMRDYLGVTPDDVPPEDGDGEAGRDPSSNWAPFSRVRKNTR